MQGLSARLCESRSLSRAALAHRPRRGGWGTRQAFGCANQGVSDESRLSGCGVPRSNGCCSRCLWRSCARGLGHTSAIGYLVDSGTVSFDPRRGRVDSRAHREHGWHVTGSMADHWIHGWCGPLLIFPLCLCLNGNRDARHGDAAWRNAVNSQLVVTDLSWVQVTPASDAGQLEVTNRQQELKTMRRLTMVNFAQ